MPRLFSDNRFVNRFMTPLLRFLRDEEGPTSVEYAIMAAFIAGVVVAGATVLGVTTGDILTTFGNVVGSLPGG